MSIPDNILGESRAWLLNGCIISMKNPIFSDKKNNSKNDHVNGLQQN
jgi:hypothetical protein